MGEKRGEWAFRVCEDERHETGGLILVSTIRSLSDLTCVSNCTATDHRCKAFYHMGPPHAETSPTRIINQNFIQRTENSTKSNKNESIHRLLHPQTRVTLSKDHTRQACTRHEKTVSGLAGISFEGFEDSLRAPVSRG